MKKIAVFGAIAAFLAVSQFSDALFPVVAEPVPVVEEALPEKAFIYVTGAVQKPGLYALDGGQTVGEAVATAGGMAAYADTAAVNLAGKASTACISTSLMTGTAYRRRLSMTERCR